MTLKYLPIIALLSAAGSASAKTDHAGTPAVSISELKTSIVPARPMPRYGDHSRTHLYFSVPDLGYSRLKIKDATGTSMNGGGFRYGGGIGVNIELGNAASATRNNMLSVGAALNAENTKIKYKNAAGEDKTDKLNLSVVSVPVSYTRLFYINGDGALFVQAGIVAGMVTSASLNEKPVKDSYNNIFFEPMISIGGSGLLHVVSRASGNDIFNGRAFFAPYFGYIVNNMSTVSGTTMNGFDVGVRWIYSGW